MSTLKQVAQLQAAVKELQVAQKDPPTDIFADEVRTINSYTAFAAEAFSEVNIYGIHAVS